MNNQRTTSPLKNHLSLIKPGMNLACFLSYFDRMYDENIGVLYVLAGRVRLEPSKCQTSNVAHGKVTHWCWRGEVGGGEGEREGEGGGEREGREGRERGKGEKTMGEEGEDKSTLLQYIL